MNIKFMISFLKAIKIMRENNLEKATIVKKKKPTINSWKYKKFKDLVNRAFKQGT